MRRPVAGVLSLLAAASIACAQTCVSSGVSVAAEGGRLGDPWRVDVHAGPLLVGVLGLDLAPGPVVTPIGTICLGLTPALQLHTLFFDAAGTASLGGVMPVNLAFVGYEISAAAVSIDPSQPNGLGLSNGDSFRVRQGRFWFVDPGTATPFGSTPAQIAASNVVTDDVVFAQPLTTTVRDAVTMRERGWLVLLLGNGSLAAYDGTSATPAWTATLTGAAAQATRMLAPPGGDTLVLLAYGTPASPFGAGTPGSVHVVSVPGGAVASVALSAGNPDAMVLVPGTSIVMLRLPNAVVPFVYEAPLLLPAIGLPAGFGAPVDWQVGIGSLLYVLHAGQAPSPFSGALPAAITVVDVSALSVMTTMQLSMAPPVEFLRAGPGSSGPALYVYGAAAATLEEFGQVTLTPVASIAAGSGITAMELSSLGTQWLVLCSGPGCGGPALFGLGVGTTALAPLASLSGTPANALAVSPSVLFGKACTAVGSVATPFGTDPFAAASSAVLPISSMALRIVVD
ncbi:MAG TPA: hypothetical protein VFZ65_18980 [Planctomycetota bacterium]|nr:hypothetical protein [Planctomycetota bacterium]